MDPGTLPEPPELVKIDPNIAKIPKKNSFLGYPVLRHQFRGSRDVPGRSWRLREDPRGPSRYLGSGTIWVDLERSGTIWNDLDLELGGLLALL